MLVLAQGSEEEGILPKDASGNCLRMVSRRSISMLEGSACPKKKKSIQRSS